MRTHPCVPASLVPLQRRWSNGRRPYKKPFQHYKNIIEKRLGSFSKALIMRDLHCNQAKVLAPEFDQYVSSPPPQITDY